MILLPEVAGVRRFEIVAVGKAQCFVTADNDCNLVIEKPLLPATRQPQALSYIKTGIVR